MVSFPAQRVRAKSFCPAVSAACPPPAPLRGPGCVVDKRGHVRPDNGQTRTRGHISLTGQLVERLFVGADIDQPTGFDQFTEGAVERCGGHVGHQTKLGLGRPGCREV
jgi:hypothetical protein